MRALGASLLMSLGVALATAGAGAQAPAAPPPAPELAPAPRPVAAPARKGMVDGEDERWGARTLSGHTFPLPLLIDHPFVATHFGVGTEVGFYSQPGLGLEYVDETGREQTFTYDANAGFLRERLALGIGLFETFELSVDADYLAFVGANEGTIFLFGGRTAYDVRPGVRGRILRASRTGTQLGGRAYAILSEGIQIQPQGLLVTLVQQIAALAASERRTTCLVAGDFACAFPDLDLAAAIQVIHTRYGGGASVSAAQPLGRHVGVLGTVGLEVARARSSNVSFGNLYSTPLDFYAGVAPSLDLEPYAPIGAMVEYRVDVESIPYEENRSAGVPAGYGETNLNHAVAAGLFYTGRRDLQLGLVLSASFLNQSAQAGPRSTVQPLAAIVTAQFTVGYFF